MTPRDEGRTLHGASRSSEGNPHPLSIPTEPVGSLPRPMKLQETIAAYDAGTVGLDQLQAEQDAACRDSIERMGCRRR